MFLDMAQKWDINKNDICTLYICHIIEFYCAKLESTYYMHNLNC